jgi:hypothetical protein
MLCNCGSKAYTISLSLANFVGSVVGFFNVCTIRLRHLLLAAALSFESEMVLLRDSRKLAVVTAQTIRLSDAPFRLEPQRFGHIRSSYAPVQLSFIMHVFA